MNYLAHLYLAEDSPESILGNFLGDFVKGSILENYSPGIQKGILTHRKIDAFTDAHPVFKESKRLITDNKRYAGIIIDIFYDYFLAKNWNEYAHIPLEQFTLKAAKVLEDHKGFLPPPLSTNLTQSDFSSLLLSYAQPEGICKTLSRVSKRLKRQANLETSIQDLFNSSLELDHHFRQFFPELVQYVYTLNLKLVK